MSSRSFAFAAALSDCDETRSAVGEVCGAVGKQLDAAPDLAMLFVSRDHAEDLDWITAEVVERVGAACLLGCVAEAIVGGGREVEGRPAISLWAARLPGVHLAPMHLRFHRAADGIVIDGWPDDLAEKWPPTAALILLGEPYSFPADLMLQQLNEDRPGVPVVGGMASGGSEAGDNRLLLDGKVITEGAVAAMIHGPFRLRTVVSQGCRPVGQHFVVTKVDGNVIRELGGKPALLQLKEVFDTLPTSEQELLQRGLHLGRVVNEYQDRFGQGDFLVRNVLGIDPDSGSVAVGDFVRVGQTVQFHLRDEETADVELRQLLNAVKDDPTSSPAAALLFTCNGRGSRFFGEPHHDAAAVQRALGQIPLAGFFAQGELGPVGGKNFVHGFTASLALFEGA